MDQHLAQLRGHSSVNKDTDFTTFPPADQRNVSEGSVKPLDYTRGSQMNTSNPTAGDADGSATEESDIDMTAPPKELPRTRGLSPPSPPITRKPPVHEAESPLEAAKPAQKDRTKSPSPSISSSPPPPSKRAKSQSSTNQPSSDSESADANSKSAVKGDAAGHVGGRRGTAGSSLRGVRQPIKRGGKRF